MKPNLTLLFVLAFGCANGQLDVQSRSDADDAATPPQVTLHDGGRARLPDAARPAVDAGVILPSDAGAPPAEFERDAGPDRSAPPAFGPVADYGAPGPWAVTREIGGPGSAFTLYFPTDLGRGGVRHPVLTWGNGTGARVSVYDALLRHYASHGFVVIASHSTSTGTAREMLQGVDFMIEEASRPGGRFEGHIDTEAIGATGHSQGGGGSINAGVDPRVHCIAPIQPAPGSIREVHGEMLLLAGSRDTIVSPRRLVRPYSYVPSPVPTVYGILQGATHFTAIGAAGGYRSETTAWFRYCLMGDTTAEERFFGECTLCSDPAWVVERKLLELR